MKRLILILAASVLLCGCLETPVREVRPIMTPIRMADEKTQAERMADFRRVTGRLPELGALIYEGALPKGGTPELALEHLTALGFNRLYVMVTSEQELEDENFVKLLETAGRYRVPVYLVVSVRDFHQRYRGNLVQRIFLPQYNGMEEIVAELAKFNAKLSPEAKISGIVAAMDVHRFNDRSHGHPQDFICRWSERSYGPGLDNDLMVRMVCSRLRTLPEHSGGLPVVPMVPDFFHDRAVAGDLSCGRIGDFLKLSSPQGRVIVRSTGNKPSDAFRVIKDELSDAGSGKVTVAVLLADHTSVSGGALRRRDWNDMIRALDYLIRHGSQYPAFNGIILGPLSTVEFLRMEQD